MVHQGMGLRQQGHGGGEARDPLRLENRQRGGGHGVQGHHATVAVFSSVHPEAAGLSVLQSSRCGPGIHVCETHAETHLPLHCTLVHVDWQTGPQETIASKLGNLGEYAKEYASNVGLSQIASGLGSVVKETLLNHSDSLVNAGVSAVSLGFPVAAPLAILVGGLVKGAISVSADVMQDAAEYAAYQNDLDNAFSQLYEVLSFGDCVKAWRETTMLAGRINRYEQNRLRIQNMDPVKYLEVRSDEIFKTLPATKEPHDEEIRRAYAKDMARDEMKLHHELGNNQKSNAENWVAPS